MSLVPIPYHFDISRSMEMMTGTSRTVKEAILIHYVGFAQPGHILLEAPIIAGGLRRAQRNQSGRQPFQHTQHNSLPRELGIIDEQIRATTVTNPKIFVALNATDPRRAGAQSTSEVAHARRIV
jgi:hypothetical protein